MYRNLLTILRMSRNSAIQDLRPEFENACRHKITVTQEIMTENTEDIENQAFECPVCYESISSNVMVKTQCDHTFCYSCILKSVKTNNNHGCPLCREKVISLKHQVSNTDIPRLEDIVIV